MSSPLKKLTVAHLKALATKHQIKGRSRMKKSELVMVLKDKRVPLSPISPIKRKSPKHKSSSKISPWHSPLYTTNKPSRGRIFKAQIALNSAGLKPKDGFKLCRRLSGLSLYNFKRHHKKRSARKRRSSSLEKMIEANKMWL
jgi:hypothetical protein